MVKTNKNQVALLLIISSIGLLLALQAFWLTNSYEKAYFDMRRETSGLFRTTIVALRDSLFSRSFRPLPEDTVLVRNRVDSLRLIPNGPAQVRVYINSQHVHGDSVSKILKPLTGRLQALPSSAGRSFVFSMISDSLQTDTIQAHFARVLHKNNINVPFRIQTKKQGPPTMEFPPRRFRMDEPRMEDSLSNRIYSNSMYSDWTSFDPVNRYSVVLSNFRPLLLKQIAPQILFAVFLTLITTAAFVMMYRSIRAQQKLMDLKNDFISNITHELKTPVTTVGVALEAIKNFKGQNNPELTTEYLEIAQNELNRLNILTDKILKTAIFEDKGVEFNAELVDMHQLVSQVIGSMKLVFEKQKATANLTITGSDFNMLGGSAHLTSVVYNLLDNALKYSPVKPAILITLSENKEEIELRVKDNGIGIAPEFKKKVFEKFFRVPTGDVHNIKGYGLGLSYVDSVIKHHKGTIDVISEPGKGSEFIIRLPKS